MTILEGYTQLLSNILVIVTIIFPSVSVHFANICVAGLMQYETVISCTLHLCTKYLLLSQTKLHFREFLKVMKKLTQSRKAHHKKGRIPIILTGYFLESCVEMNRAAAIMMRVLKPITFVTKLLGLIRKIKRLRISIHVLSSQLKLIFVE